MTNTKRRKDGSLFPALRNNLFEELDMNQMVNQPFMEKPPVWEGDYHARIPGTNVRESKSEFLLELAAPGLNKQDFHVDLLNDTLHIEVDKELAPLLPSAVKQKETALNYIRKEYDFTSFYREFILPETVKRDAIKAVYKNGILTIRLPKIAQAKQQKVKKEIAIA